MMELGCFSFLLLLLFVPLEALSGKRGTRWCHLHPTSTKKSLEGFFFGSFWASRSTGSSSSKNLDHPTALGTGGLDPTHGVSMGVPHLPSKAEVTLWVPVPLFSSLGGGLAPWVWVRDGFFGGGGHLNSLPQTPGSSLGVGWGGWVG